ncbi:MAG TPA: serine protease [Streptosporangiaceae bacterium]|nr:serine protease [Streptosporangiaceae bacterium]
MTRVGVSRTRMTCSPASGTRARARLRWLAVAVAAAVAAGCSPAPTAGRLPVTVSGPSGYWTRSRLLGASPLRGPGYRDMPAPGQTPDARPAVLALRVGALFVREGSTDHFCTASVVASPGRDLLITAAHCIHGGKGGGYSQDIVFIPGYRDGQAPFGIWAVQRLLVAPQWISGSDPSLDVGFVVLQPHDGQNIEDVLGANQLGLDSGYRYLVRVTGYPDSADAPITCVNWTTEQSTTQLRFDCGGFTGGTSGSPWVTHFNSRTRTGTIVGVIGGYQEGGYTAAISYSSYLGNEVQRLYQDAIADAAP